MVRVGDFPSAWKRWLVSELKREDSGRQTHRALQRAAAMQGLAVISAAARSPVFR